MIPLTREIRTFAPGAKIAFFQLTEDADTEALVRCQGCNRYFTVESLGLEAVDSGLFNASPKAWLFALICPHCGRPVGHLDISAGHLYIKPEQLQ